MHRIKIFLLLAAFPVLVFAEQCSFTEDQLIGVWLAKGDVGIFGEMEFRLEGNRRVFNSWLEHRPEFTDGSWAIKNCKLKISHSTQQALSFDFVVRFKNRDSLELEESGEPVVKYRRSKPKNAP